MDGIIVVEVKCRTGGESSGFIILEVKIGFPKD
jgi:hypothetical protein